MASTYLTRTFSLSNRRTFTISYWTKRTEITAGAGADFSAGASNAGVGFDVGFGSTDKFFIYDYDGVADYGYDTTAVFRDCNAWYHIVVAVDTTQATESNRAKLYVNGEQITLNNTYDSFPQNYDTYVNTAITHGVNTNPFSSTFRDKLFAHFHFIDGTAYDASAFGETDATTGIWKPKTAPSVTYGTNGFFLKFENSGSMGTDSSGNGNNFTVNGTLTQTVDTPSNVFATWNPLDNYYSASTFSEGNLKIATGVSSNTANLSTIGVSTGKWYAEIKVVSKGGGNDDYLVGIISDQYTANNQNLGNTTGSYAYYGYNGKIRSNNSYTVDPYGNTYTAGDIIGIALDLDNNKLYFSKNGTWQNSGDPESGSTGTGAVSITSASSQPLGAYFFAATLWQNTASGTFAANFGNGYFGTTAVSSAQNPDDGIGIFEYDVPTGYRALCTKSINAQEYS